MAATRKKSLCERDICTKYITPAIQAAGWDVQTQMRKEVSFTTGRIIVWGDTSETLAHRPKDRPRRGDILIAKDGTIGRAAIVETDDPFCINQSVAVLWLESCLLYRPFLLLVIRSPWTQEPIWEAAEGLTLIRLTPILADLQPCTLAQTRITCLSQNRS